MQGPAGPENRRHPESRAHLLCSPLHLHRLCPSSQGHTVGDSAPHRPYISVFQYHSPAQIWTLSAPTPNSCKSITGLGYIQCNQLGQGEGKICSYTAPENVWWEETLTEVTGPVQTPPKSVTSAPRVSTLCGRQTSLTSRLSCFPLIASPLSLAASSSTTSFCP